MGKRPAMYVWSCLTLAQVVKHKAKGKFHIARYVLRGSCTMLVRLRTATQLEGTINTAFIERLNGTFRAYLAPLTRRTHGLARTQQSISDAILLFGCVYNFCRLHSTLKHSSQLWLPSSPTLFGPFPSCFGIVPNPLLPHLPFSVDLPIG
jgi:hypothetical protein